MDQDLIAKATEDLENSIVEDEQQEKQEKDLGASIVKAIKDTAAEYFGKAQTTDLKAENDRRGSLTESSQDPAKTAKKTGKEYHDSSKYETRKGDDCDDDMDGDDLEDKKKSKKKMSKMAYMNKMKKMGKMKKSRHGYDDENEGEEFEESALDATEFVEAMGESVEEIEKSMDRMEEGMAVFGELLGEMSDPKRDKLIVNIAKGIGFLVDQMKDLNKSVSAQNDLVKSISQLPGAPRIAGLPAQTVNNDEIKKGEEGDTLTKGEKDRIFQLATSRRISMDEYRNAIRNNDASILEKVK